MRGEVQLRYVPQAEQAPRVEQEQRGLRLQQEKRSNGQQREPLRARAFEIAVQAANRRYEAGKGQAQPSTLTNGASIDVAASSTFATTMTAIATAPSSANPLPPPATMQPTTLPPPLPPNPLIPSLLERKRPNPPRAAKLAKQATHYTLVLDAARRRLSSIRRRSDVSYLGAWRVGYMGTTRRGVRGRKEGPTESHLSAADLKIPTLSSNPRHFYLKLPRGPTATYWILYYRSKYLCPESKVDILTPGTMLLPPVMEKEVSWLGPVEPELNDLHGAGTEGFGLNGLRTAALKADVPLIPFPVLLLHKLQGRDDHRLAKEKHKWGKMTQDAKDIVRLLAMKTQVGGMRDGWDGRVKGVLLSLRTDNWKT
ncbi:hypothetical protein BDQ12DRAFT_716704 [Crucibulum laeve]|uniref:Uncharacterized protein n=1 Tax=Crucibulum laeve TaxID=68775 RepID=A0A5C3LFL6_9AGAR|nr:hypothetical protein BDQ12DRAFT_716704 [Crucibulum laeve]